MINDWKNSHAAPPDIPDEAIASFRVYVTSVDDSTWQGVEETNGKTCHFRSEIQLLHWVMEQFPALRPDAAWENKK